MRKTVNAVILKDLDTSHLHMADKCVTPFIAENQSQIIENLVKIHAIQNEIESIEPVYYEHVKMLPSDAEVEEACQKRIVEEEAFQATGEQYNALRNRRNELLNKSPLSIDEIAELNLIARKLDDLNRSRKSSFEEKQSSFTHSSDQQPKPQDGHIEPYPEFETPVGFSNDIQNQFLSVATDKYDSTAPQVDSTAVLEELEMTHAKTMTSYSDRGGLSGLSSVGLLNVIFTRVKQLGAISLEYIVWFLIGKTIGLGNEAFIFGIAPVIVSEVLGHHFRDRMDRHLRANSRMSLNFYIIGALIISTLGGGLIVLDQKIGRLEYSRIVVLRAESNQARKDYNQSLLNSIKSGVSPEPLQVDDRKSNDIAQSISKYNHWYDMVIICLMTLLGGILILTAAFMSAKAIVESAAYQLKTKLVSLQNERNDRIKNVLQLIELQYRVRYLYALIAAKKFLHDHIVQNVYKIHLQ